MSAVFRPFLEELPSRILPSMHPHTLPMEHLPTPPVSDCVETRMMASHERVMDIAVSPDNCCHSASEIRLTHDGKGNPPRQKCPTDTHTWRGKSHAMGHATDAHERPHLHLLHENHREHPNIPHPPHVKHETQKTHVPHAPHMEKDIHTESSPLDEHDKSREGEQHERMERSELLRDRDDSRLFEEAFQWGAWWQDPLAPLSPSPLPSTTEGNNPLPGNEQEAPPPPSPPSDFWPLIGGATVSATALAGAFALEQRAQRFEKMQGKMYNDGMSNTFGARDDGGDPMSEYTNGGHLPSKEAMNAFFIELGQADEQEINALLHGKPLQIQKGTLGQVHNVLPPEDIPQIPQTEKQGENKGKNVKPKLQKFNPATREWEEGNES